MNINPLKTSVMKFKSRSAFKRLSLLFCLRFTRTARVDGVKKVNRRSQGKYIQKKRRGKRGTYELEK